MPWPQTEPIEFNRSAFDRLYQETERSIYSDVYELRAWLYLEDFDSSICTLPLASGLRIRKLSHSEQEDRLRQALAPIPPPGSETTFDVLRTPFVLEMEYDIPRSETISLDKPSKTFVEVISALRLFKPGRVGHGTIYQRVAYPQPSMHGILSHPAYEIPFIHHNRYQTYALSDAEGIQFQKFYEWLSKILISNEPRLDLAIRRFNQAHERPIPADKLIDLLIAFEALLLPKTGELALRLSLRVANLLRDIRDRQQVFSAMKKAYKLRNNVVHGGKIDDQELIPCVPVTEELLRQSIRVVLEAKEQGQNLRNIIEQLDDATFT
jgi:hypothetical protein